VEASAQQSAATVADFPHGRVPRELRQRQIVELAEQLFAERGYRGASMDELSRRAGVTKPVIYELFGSKDGLFRVCVERAVQGMAESVAAAVRAETAPEARLRAGGIAFLRFAAENRVAWDLLAMGGGGRFADQMQTVRRSQAQLIRQLMEEMAAEEVDARELEAAAYAVNSAYEGAAHWMWEHPDVPVEQVADWIVDLLVPGLRRFT
jgi:AcrR family transcriptional regulator